MTAPTHRPPRLSAVTILLAPEEDGALLVLVGQRNPAIRFLGGFHAFPGGVLDPVDGDVAADGKDAVLRRTASRELEEETGLRVAPGEFSHGGTRITPPFAPVRFESPMYVAWRETPETPAPADPGELLDLEWSRPHELAARWRRREIRMAPPVVIMVDELARAAEAGEDFAAIVKRLRAVNGELEAHGPRIEFVPGIAMVPVLARFLMP